MFFRIIFKCFDSPQQAQHPERDPWAEKKDFILFIDLL
jgi:hypothetical protein